MWVSGRYFDESLLARIQATVDADPGLSRRALSRQVCEWMGWRAPNGRLQEMSCRKALVTLERKGALRLPPASRGHGYERRGKGRGESLVFREVRGELSDLGRVELVVVRSRYSRASRVWNELMERYHDLGAGPLCGAQMRYLVRSERHGWLGALAFDSATRHLKARDRWIGWSAKARQANLGRVIRNSRFLILPTVKVPNLASHVLARAVGQVAEDWEERYGVRPVLVETFVDPTRYRGVSYRAANWQWVGQTAGSQHTHPNGKRPQGPKDIYVYPLCAEFREVLCREPTRRLGERPSPRTSADWAEAELGALDVTDGRIRKRAIELARDFLAKPQGGIPEACGGSTAKIRAAYRFFDNPQVDMDTVLDAHTEQSLERIRQHRVVLAVQDTTDLNYTHHALGTEGLGPLQSIHDLTVGLKLHTTLALTPEGIPLGIVHARCWARDGEEGEKDPRRPIEEKESFRWLESYRRVQEIQALCPDTVLVSVGDREADIYDLFEEAQNGPSPRPKLLVRAHRGRKRKVETDEPRVKGGEGLWAYMARQPVVAYPVVHIPRRGNRKARDATVAVRHARIRLKPPQGRTGRGVELWAIYAHEVDYDPQEVKSPLSWMLLTTVETNTAEEAVERLGWYAKRWGIEVFHRILKSGCRIRDRQMRTAERLETCLALDMIIAWRIQWLTVQGRETPEVGCDLILEEAEWQALYAHVHRRAPPKKPPTLREAIWMIAKLGGFMGRKRDGEPGPTVLWRGMSRLPDLAAGWRAALAYMEGARASP